MGEAPDRMFLIAHPEDVDRLEVPDPDKVAYLTQTTLSVDDTRDCIEALRRRFPKIVGPSKDDICYATQNRQAAVKTVAGEVDVLLVIGAANSSNANRLVEVSRVMGTPSHLINDRNDMRAEWLEGARRVGITAGASTPEFLVTEVVEEVRRMRSPRRSARCTSSKRTCGSDCRASSRRWRGGPARRCRLGAAPSP